MRHAGTKTIETERLLLRRLLPQDAAAMYQNWACDPAVTKYLRWEPHRSPEDTRALLTAWAELYANEDYYQWAIVDKAAGEVFGTISLFDAQLSPAGHAMQAHWRAAGLDCSGGAWEVGYCIGRPWWNKGYMTEALRAVVRYWFTETDGTWLHGCHAVQNTASGAVMRKAGFRYRCDGINYKFDGTPAECRYYLLTQDDYKRFYT